jgi:hypothetical protein
MSASPPTPEVSVHYEVYPHNKPPRQTMACGVAMRIVELEDVIFLFRAEVKQAGGQEAWAKRTGVNRAVVNKVVNVHR